MLILQFFFGGVCGFLVGFNRRPTDALGLRIWFSRHTCGVPGYYKSASFIRPALEWGFPAHLRCTALLGIGVLQTPVWGMGLPGDLFDRLAGDDLSIQSVSFGRHGVSVGLAYLAVPGSINWCLSDACLMGWLYGGCCRTSVIEKINFVTCWFK